MGRLPALEGVGSQKGRASVMNGSTPKERAKHLKKHLAKIYDDGRGATEDNITDMLTDLRHLCDAQHIDFAHCNRIADNHYTTEHAHNSVEVS